MIENDEYNVKKYQRLAKRYKISENDLLAMLEASNGICTICQGPLGSFGVVDHCHSTGSVRGLLCNDCNLGLGRFKDNIDSLYRAIEYLKIAGKNQCHS